MSAENLGGLKPQLGLSKNGLSHCISASRAPLHAMVPKVPQIAANPIYLDNPRSDYHIVGSRSHYIP